MNADARSLAIVAVLVMAPVALVLLAAILRGYTVTLHMTRDGSRRKGANDAD